jgi:flavin reductase (DIM6/NTAB) family NADH-FMN oxidoreductase RutF
MLVKQSADRSSIQNMTALENQDENLGSAMGCIPSGLYIVTTTQNGETGTMLASWVQQAAFNPPAVTPGSTLVVNILEKGQGKLIGHFSKSFEPGIDPLAGIAISTAPSGQPYLEEAIAYLDAEVVTSLDAGDHSVVLAKLSAGVKMRDGEVAVHTRKNGFKY